MRKSRDKFQEALPAELFGGGVTFDQWRGIDAILNEYDNFYPDMPLSALAYVLGTFYHETSGRMFAEDFMPSGFESGVALFFRAMVQGTFSGAKLADYFTGREPAYSDFYFARRILNGTEWANKIATYAEQFYAALK